MREGSALAWVRPLDWVEGQTLVRVWSITNVGMRIEDGLAEFLATENGKLVFGRLELGEERPAVSFAHTLLADFVNRAELAAAVRVVAMTADEYDDGIKERFGGGLFREATGGMNPAARLAVSPRSVNRWKIRADRRDALPGRRAEYVA